MESRTQGSKPRTQKKSEAQAKDSLSEDRHSRGQGQECSRLRPRTKDTSASALQKKKKVKKRKKGLHKNFSGDLHKKTFSKKFFKRSTKFKFHNSKNSAVLEPRTGQFLRPRPSTSKCRGGVEDTRLEAKAKDTKKIRGQGQPFRGQTLSRPRTGMLEAKAKDQGHKRKCYPK